MIRRTPFSHIPFVFPLPTERTIEFSCIVACLRRAGRCPATWCVNISRTRPRSRHDDFTAWAISTERVRTHHEDIIRQGDKVNSSHLDMDEEDPAAELGSLAGIVV